MWYGYRSLKNTYENPCNVLGWNSEEKAEQHGKYNYIHVGNRQGVENKRTS